MNGRALLTVIVGTVVAALLVEWLDAERHKIEAHVRLNADRNYL